MASRTWPLLCVVALCLGGEWAVRAADSKDAPRVVMVLPLGVVPGTPTRLTVRGLKLDTATELRFTDPKATARILNKGKAPLGKDQMPAQVGDTQVEVEVNLPPGAAGTFVVVTPAGESKPHELLVDPAVAEKEPNNGFAQAQPLTLPQAVDGTIGQPQDVDVFRFEGKAGQRVVLEVFAARHGSALDSVLTLYDSGGRELASNDDADGSADSRLEVTLPRDGTYFVSLLDAHDQGGPTHVYRVVARLR
jgi:hypothetical protein